MAILVEVSQARSLYVQAEAALAAARNNLALQSALMNYYLGQSQATKSTLPAGDRGNDSLSSRDSRGHDRVFGGRGRDRAKTDRGDRTRSVERISRR